MLILPPQSILMEKFDQHLIIGGLLREGSLGAFKAGKEMTDLWVSAEQEYQTEDQSQNYSRTITLEGVARRERKCTHDKWGNMYSLDPSELQMMKSEGKGSSLGGFYFWVEHLAGGRGITCQDLASTKRWGLGGISKSSLGLLSCCC